MTTLADEMAATRRARLSEAIEKSGLSQSEISREMEVSRSTVSSWLKPKRGQPSAEDCVELGRLLTVRPEWLLGISDQMEPAAATAPQQPRDGSWIAIPRLTDRRALERQIGPIDENHPEKTVFAALVHGDSMAPRIEDGDTVIVQKFFRSSGRAPHREREALRSEHGRRG